MKPTIFFILKNKKFEYIKMFSINQLAAIKNQVDEKIYAERERYIKIYQVIETYIEKHNKRENCIILGGTYGINLLLHNKRAISDYEYILYSENAFVHANDLTNLIDSALIGMEKDDESIKIWGCSLKTVLPNKKYNIIIDERPIVEFNMIRAQDVSIYDLILPTTVGKFLILPLMFHLMDMYRSLYSPAQAGKWEELLGIEKKIITNLSVETLKGAGEEFVITGVVRQKIVNQIIEKFITNNQNCVLIGEYALKLLINTEVENNILQIIYAPSEQLKIGQVIEKLAPIRKIVADVTKRDIPVEFSYGNVKVMQDTRLMRISVKIGSERNRKEVMYIYAITYDMIPFNKIYVKKGLPTIQVGDPFVIMRFLLIEIWIIRWISASKKIEKTFADRRINSLISRYVTLHKMLDKQTGGLRVFSKQFVGVYEDEILMQKISMQQSKRYAQYSPRKYLADNKQYRTVGDKMEKN
jgi:hypothetical protein